MSKKDDAEQLKMLRFVREHTADKTVGGIKMTSAQAAEYRKNFCPGCGGQMKISMMYFGDLFCVPCVEKFTENAEIKV